MPRRVSRAFWLLFLCIELLASGCGSSIALLVDNGRLTLRVSVNPDSLVLVIGGDPQTMAVSLARQGDTGPVNLSLDGVPAGVTTQIDQPGILDTGKITFQATSSAAAQTGARVTVIASDGASSDTREVMLDIVH